MTTPRTRGTMALLTLATVLLSLVAILCRKTSAVMVPTLAAIVPSVWTGVYGFLIARRRAPTPFAERILFVFLVWLATLHVAFTDFDVIGMSGGSGIGLVFLLLGLPWSIAIVGSWAFASRRLLELEHAHRRMKANACWLPAQEAFTKALVFVPLVAVGVAQARTDPGAAVVAGTALPLVVGGFALLRGWPRDVRSRLGQAEFLLVHLVASVFAMPLFTLLTWGPVSKAFDLHEGITMATGYLLGGAVSFAVLSVRLWWVAP